MEETKTFLKNEVNTELDAIHPRFLPKQDPQALNQYEIENHYFCEQCKLFMAPTCQALNLHFTTEMVQHHFYHSCRYCRGPVFEYKINNETQYHHNCRDTPNRTDNNTVPD